MPSSSSPDPESAARALVNRSVIVTRTVKCPVCGGGSWNCSNCHGSGVSSEYVAIGDDLNTPDAIDSFLADVRQKLIDGYRMSTYGESDEFHRAYGYRIRNGVRYDETKGAGL